MTLRFAQIASLAATLLGAAACGLAGEHSSSDPREKAKAAERQGLEHDGVSLTLPLGWEGRVLPLDYPAAVMQAANFEFAPVPSELPPGDQDPIKAMTSAHVLVSILPCGLVSFEKPPRSAPERLTLVALTSLPASHSRVPRGHAFAHASFEFGDRCLRIEANFGSPRPSAELTKAVDDVLGSLVVADG